MAAIIPVILAGGAGTRLWPVAREEAPKQFHAFDAEASMLQQTAARFAGDARFAAPMIACGADHRGQVDEALAGAAHGALLLEPVRRNTAAAIAAAAEYMRGAFGGDSVIAIVPVDHQLGDAASFREVLAGAAQVAAGGKVVVVGITPTDAETGYGYIEMTRDGGVARFVEKPDAETAHGFIAAGNFLWNAGIVVARADVLLGEFAAHCPVVGDAARVSVERAVKERGVVAMDGESYSKSPAISFDYAVLEKSRNLAVVRGDFGWADLGTWAAIREARDADANGNVLIGDVRAEDCRNVYVRSDAGTIAVIGLENMIVVRSGDAVLVAPMDRAQDVGKLATIETKTPK